MDSMQQQIDELRRRIEKLEGKERSPVYDPGANAVAEALVERCAIAKAPLGDARNMEAALKLEPGTFDEVFAHVEQELKRPGGLLEQLSQTDQEPQPERSEILLSSGEKMPIYIVDGQVFLPANKVVMLTGTGKPKSEPFPEGYIAAKLEEGFAEMERARRARAR